MHQTPTVKHLKLEQDGSIIAKVAKCVSLLETKGILVPTRIADIPELPLNNFDDLQQKLRDRSLLLQRLSNRRQLWIEEAVSEPHENRSSFPIGAFVTAVGALALAIGVSGWFLFAVLLVPVQLIGYAKTVSGKYDQKVIRAASLYESAFCMLYRVGHINLTTPDYQAAWHWKGENE